MGAFKRRGHIDRSITVNINTEATTLTGLFILMVSRGLNITLSKTWIAMASNFVFLAMFLTLFQELLHNVIQNRLSANILYL